MNESILKKYPDLFSKDSSIVTKAIQELSPDDITPELSSILVWFACFQKYKESAQAAYQVWHDKYASTFIYEGVQWQYKFNYSQEKRLVMLSELILKTPRKFFSAPTFAELFRTQFKPIKKFSTQLALFIHHLPEIFFNPDNFFALEEITITEINNQRLPHRITEFKTLKRLIIQSGSLKELSPFIGRLNQLEKLSIRDTKLSELPQEVAELTKLKHLDLANNQLTYIPEAVFELPHLETIDLRHNKLLSLPKKNSSESTIINNWLEIYRKVCLKTGEESTFKQWLGLDRTTLQKNRTLALFAASFFEQTKLEKELKLTSRQRVFFHNQKNTNAFEKLITIEVLIHQAGLDQTVFEAICDEVIEIIESHNLRDLKNKFGIELSVLNLTRSLLEACDFPSRLLPYVREFDPKVLKGNNTAWIKNLKNLKVLDLSNQNLSKIPVEIYSITKLKELRLDRNNIKVIPTEITQLKHLEQLNLNNNQLSDLPPEIEQLTELKTLKLNSNQFQSLPKVVFCLPKLKTLEAKYNSIVDWPGLSDIPKNTQLSKILLSHNVLESLPEEWHLFPKLKTLDVSHNHIRCLPESLDKLPKLTHLEINHNWLEKLPEFLVKYTLNKGFLGNFFGEIPTSLEEKCVEALLSLPIRLSSRELAQVLCIYYFYPKAEVRKKAYQALRSRIDPFDRTRLPEWPHRKMYYSRLPQFLTQLSKLLPKIDWQVFDAWMKRSAEYPNTDRRIDIKEFVLDWVKAMPETPYITWERIGIWIERDQLRAQQKYEYEEIMGFYQDVSQLNPSADWLLLHQWVLKTDALYLKKIEGLKFVQLITQIIQKFTPEQWVMVDEWVKSSEIRTVHKINYEQLLTLLIEATHINPSLNWVLIDDWVRQVEALSHKRVDYMQCLIRVIQTSVQIPALDWEMLTLWLSRLEAVSNKKRDNQEFLEQIFKSEKLLGQLDWEMLESWITNMNIQSNKPVNLQHLFRTEFPDFIFNCWKNASVNLSGNLLSAIPKGLHQNEKLEELDLSQNMLEAMAYFDISSIKQVKKLNLAYNTLERFPNELMECTQLKWLDLSHNRLWFRLPIIGKLPYLKHLNLSFNFFKQFPFEETAMFPKITHLNLAFNYLQKIPEVIAGFEFLEVLDLSYNQLGADDKTQKDDYHYALPLKISFLENITHLYLQHNGLAQLPPGIGLIENLQVLDCNNNRFKEFPVEICEAEHLEVLNFAHNQITYIPPEIQYMTNLKKLDLSGNPLTAYEVLKIQRLIAHVEVIFDEYTPPTFDEVLLPEIPMLSEDDQHLVTIRQTPDIDPMDYLLRSIRQGDIQAMVSLSEAAERRLNSGHLTAYWNRTAALYGIDSAQIKMGLLAKPNSNNTNQDQSVYWYTLAAQQGIQEAQMELAEIYRKGLGMNKNIKYAIYWLEKAAQQENWSAMNNLAEIYEAGKETNQDYTKAFYWYKKLAQQNDTNAQQKLAEFYLKGIGTDKDLATAISLYEKLDAKGIKIPFYTLAWGYYKGMGVSKNSIKALVYFEKSANSFEIEGQLMMGKLYLKGELIDQNYEKAFRYFETVERRGNIEAMRLLGYLYQNGKGCPFNLTKAIHLYQKAAKTGDVEAQYMLGEIFLEDKKKLAQAKEWFEKAAAQDYELAKKRLGDIYANGWGVDKDEATAGYWYSQVDSDLLGV